MLIYFQLQEPFLLLGKEKFAGVDIRVRVRGGGHVAQIYGKHIGYKINVETLVLPVSLWITHYYAPLQRRGGILFC